MRWLTARIYDRFMADAEHVCFGRWRASLLASLSGDVLEVGVGTGANLPHYPSTLTRLVLCEPDRHMRAQLDRRLTSLPGNTRRSVVAAPIEALPFDDAEFDAVVATFVLCSVHDVQRSLAEVHRVLRPGGQLVFMEHVAAHDEPARLRRQRLIEPFWKLAADNCHLTRDTEASIAAAGFELAEVTRERSPVGPSFVTPMVRGIARKASPDFAV